MNGRIRKTTRHSRAIDDLLPRWILSAAVGSVSVTWIRVSARSAGKLILNTDDISAALAHRLGIQRLAAAGGALAQISARGGGRVEAYPEAVTGRKTSGSFLFNGTVEMFEKAGFEVVDTAPVAAEMAAWRL